MRWIQYSLVVLSLVTYAWNPVFWQGPFYGFFLWLISFHLNWFFLQSVRYIRLNLLLNTCLLIANLIIQPSLPLFLIGLWVLEVIGKVRINLKSIIIVIGLIAIIIIAYLNKGITLNDCIQLLGISILCYGFANIYDEVEQTQRDKSLLKARLDQVERELQANDEQLKVMEEVHALRERQRISRDLHDSVGHTLSTIIIQLQAMIYLAKDNSELSPMLTELYHFAKDGLANVRQVIYQLKPDRFKELALLEHLSQLIETFEKNTGIKTQFRYNQLLFTLSESQEDVLLRAVQEFLTNTVKYANAELVKIRCHFTTESLVLTMEDNGKGSAEVVENLGIGGMRERIQLLNGTLTVTTAPGRGFKVRITLPKGGNDHGIND